MASVIYNRLQLLSLCGHPRINERVLLEHVLVGILFDADHDVVLVRVPLECRSAHLLFADAQSDRAYLRSLCVSPIETEHGGIVCAAHSVPDTVDIGEYIPDRIGARYGHGLYARDDVEVESVSDGSNHRGRCGHHLQHDVHVRVEAVCFGHGAGSDGV